MAIEDDVLEPLRPGVVGTRLPIDESEEPFASRAEEVIAAVVGRVREGGHVDGALQHGGKRVVRLGAEGVDPLSSVRTVYQQQVDTRAQVLARARIPRDK